MAGDAPSNTRSEHTAWSPRLRLSEFQDPFLSSLSFQPPLSGWFQPPHLPHPLHSTGELFRSCPSPRAAFRVQQRVVGRWTADKGDWGSGGACWRCLFVSPNLSPKLWSLPFIWPDNRPKPCSTPRGEICAPARWQQPTVTLGSAPTDELDRSGKEQPGGEPPGSR